MPAATPVDPYQRLIAITRSITQVMDLDLLFDSVIDAAVEITGAERGYLLLLDPDESLPLSERLRVGASRQLEPDEIEHSDFHASRTAIMKTLAAKCGLEWADALSEPDPSQSVVMMGLRSILCEPLVHQDKILGVIYLDSQLTSRFNEGARELLPSLAAQAAICIENTCLVGEREEALRREHAELAYRDAMAAFMSIASHDLKGPLTVLKTGLSVLRVSGADRGLLVDMEQALQKAQRLVAMYLDANALQQDGSVNLTRAGLELRSLVEEEFTHLKRFLGSRRLDSFEFINRVEPDTLVWADSDRLRQVLANLLENAVKYAPDGGRVEVRSQSLENQVVIEVADQGMGISEEGLARLFEPYVRVHDTDVRGSGLGLWIVRRLVESHGGRIEVESQEGQGSLFRLYLPKRVGH